MFYDKFDCEFLVKIGATQNRLAVWRDDGKCCLMAPRLFSSSMEMCILITADNAFKI